MHIRSVFHIGTLAGDTPGYWDHQWDGVNPRAFADSIDASPGPIFGALRDLVRPGMRVLEAGCGSAGVVEFLRRRGADVVGLDFAQLTLESARKSVPELALTVGDLERLPFRDGSFDLVVSNGALEHIISGPYTALAEHRRVLRPGGVLFITVPVVSWLKGGNDFRHLRLGRERSYVSARGRTVTVQSAFGPAAPSPSSTFIQYEFRRNEWLGILSQADFRIESAAPMLTNAGVGESRLIRKISGRSSVDDHDGQDDLVPSGASVESVESVESVASVASVAQPGPSPEAGPKKTSFPLAIKRAVLHEDPAPGLAPLTWLARRAFGHMLVVQAVRPT